MQMMKYRMKYKNKPTLIEAVQFDRSKAEKDVAKYYPMVTDMAKLTTAEVTEERGDRFFISSSKGDMTVVRDGDYIMKRWDGEFDVGNPYIFEKLFVVIDDEEDELIGIIYSQLLEEFGFGYSEKDLWMIAENIAKKITMKKPKLDDNYKYVLDL
ncbi:hypothetical protein CUS80_05530 [Enterococcus faecium]|uniref:hypothetical protein n=1 Tax=Enterococcus faecium TaxID=1352 RepID=UPI000CF30E69|nr:hypothetical protein [Enterococcus faecium]PQG46362.1 hypothetical protein CUS80_05530 [Enterococcus faecium]